MNPIETREAEQFFSDFVTAFATFDGRVVAERYLEPFVAIDGEGAQRLLKTRAEIGNYFQGFLNDYRAKGSTSCRYDELEIVAMGSTSALLTVSWELMNDLKAVVQTWRESYVVVRLSAGLFVTTSIDHREV